MRALDDVQVRRAQLELSYPPDYVDRHLSEGQLMRVAEAYAAHAAGTVKLERAPSQLHRWLWVPVGWPLHPLQWTPHRDPRRTLLDAAAYALIELDRLDRAAAAMAPARKRSVL